MVGTVPPAMRQEAAARPSVSSVAAGAEAEAAVGAVSAAGGMPLSADDEAFIKRNTDCVYFLASPLTCKKGSECEYRHSDYARMNPRDCWYWLNGNCLNPKCSFRHPPLDGLLGTQMPNPVSAPGPASQPAIIPTAAASGSFGTGKQGVACIFFQKGNCLKGDWCPFSHGSNPASNKVPQTQATVLATEPDMFKKTFGLEKCTQEKKAPHANNLKSVGLTNQTNLINKVESASAKQDFSSKKNFHHSSGTVDEPHRNRPADTRLANDGSRVNMPNRVQQPFQVNTHAPTLNVKDAEEASREPSPGFDVLVNNEHGDSDYYHNEDQFVRARDHEEMIEYFDGHSGDYSARVDEDRDLYRDSRAYDSYERPQGRLANEQHRSSKTMSGGLGHQERRRYGRADSPDQGDHSDLRHRLSKHRQSNGLSSVINHDTARERPDDRRHQVSQRDLGRDHERQEPHLSSRLRGRIKIPATDRNDHRLNNRDAERGREYSSRLSPGRSQVSSRLRDRIKGLVQDGTNNDGRIDRGPLIKRDIMNDNYSNFSAPRSLSELKSQKNADGHDQQVTGKRKYMKSDYQQQAGDNLSFEGPKPLEEILKRKRGAGTGEFESNQISNNIRSNIQEGNEEILDFALSNVGSGGSLHKNEDYKSGDVTSVSEALADDKSVSHITNDAEDEEGMIVEDGGEDQDPEAYEQGDEEFDYEQGDEENYNLDENEIGDGEEEEYLDEDDDEFAKKMGVLY